MRTNSIIDNISHQLLNMLIAQLIKSLIAVSQRIFFIFLLLTPNIVSPHLDAFFHLFDPPVKGDQSNVPACSLPLHFDRVVSPLIETPPSSLLMVGKRK